MKSLARLYVEDALGGGEMLALSERASHYLAHVLRTKPGDRIALFNGRDGEFSTEISAIHKKTVQVMIDAQTREFQASPDLWLCFAPVKNEKIDFIARRATELGVSRIIPVITQHTIVSRVNMERMRANAIEAAEQCERLDVPTIVKPVRLSDLLSGWNTQRLLIHCDEAGEGTPVKQLLPRLPQGSYGVLIGPEGGFSPEERGILKKQPYIKPLSLGPRILRVETAVLAALANMQAWVGDWNK